jgi:hypothetical protein
MQIHTHTEPADWHPNEDAIAFVRHPSDAQILICALADGQGGQAGGAMAAQSAVSVCLDIALRDLPQELSNPFTWISIGEATDKEVCNISETGFTSLVGLAVCPSFVAGASCGDSAVALLLGDEFTLLTENQHKNPPIGSGAACLTPFSARLDAPWKLLIVSDGGWKHSGWERIENLLRREDGSRLLKVLRDIVIESAGGRLADDLSVLIIHP